MRMYIFKIVRRMTRPGTGTRTALISHTIVVIFFLLLYRACADESASVFKLGERFYNDSLYNLALEQYQKYLNMKRSNENDPAAYYKVAYCHYKLGDAKESAEAFEEFIRLFPGETNSMDAMYMAGTSRKILGDYREASDWFFSVWSRFVGSAQARSALFEAAECAEKDNNVEKALELYALFVNKFGKHENARPATVSLVKMYIDKQEYAQAEEILNNSEKAWNADKAFSVRTLYFKGLLAKRTQKIELAEKRFQEMADLDKTGFPEMEQAYKEYIDVLTIQKKYEAAQKIYARMNDAYKRASKKPAGAFLIAWADNARRALSYNDAISLYNTILTELPDEVNGYLIRYRLAECLAGVNNFPEAIENLRMIELQDTTGEYASRAILTAAELYYNKGIFPSAIAAYRRYLQLPERSDKDRIIYKIGKIYEEKYQRFGAALREFESLLKLYPASSYYQRTVFAIAHCQELLNEYENAIRNYEYIIESGGDNELIEQSAKRAEYIRNFKIRDFEKAVYNLAELMGKDQSKVTVFERVYSSAAIFEKYLKDYSRALEGYKQIDSIEPLPDSLKALVMISKAHIYNKLYEKAQFESNPQTADYSKEMAITLFKEILNRFGNSSFADEAAYYHMILTSPNISEYETFITRYPRSRYLPDIYMNIAKHYEQRAETVDKKFGRKVVEAYSEIVRRFPASRYAPQAFVALAKNYLALGEIDSTEKILNVFMERFPNSLYDAEAYYLRGIVANMKGDYKNAIDIFKQVLYRYPFSAFIERARYELASAERITGKVYEALNDYRLYLQNYSDGGYATESKYGIAKCLLQLDKREEALKLFDELLVEKLPEDISADIHYELGRIAESGNMIYEAIDHYKSALKAKKFPYKTNVLIQMGALYFDNRIYDEATNSYESALEWTKGEADSVELLTRTITAMIMDGKGGKADKRIKKIKDEYGDKYRNNLAEIIYYEGIYLVVEKEYDKAINRFRYIVQKYEQSPRCDDAAYQIGLAIYYQNKIDEALEVFMKFPVEYPASEFVPLAYFKIGMIFHGQNEFMRASEYFSKVISDEKVDSKTRFRAVNNAAVAYQKTSSWLDAARMYSIMLSEYPAEIHLSSCHLKIGFCLIQASKIEEALEHFNKANSDPNKEDLPEILYWIGTCYSKMGDYSKAIAEYLKVPYLYSGIGKWGVTAEFEAARLYERLGEYNKAKTLYAKIVRSDGEQGRFGKKALERTQQLNTLTGGNE